MTDEDAFSFLQDEYSQIQSVIYFSDNPGAAEVTPKYTGNLWTEMSLYSAVIQEYKDVLSYEEYVNSVISAPQKYRVMQSLFGVDGRELHNVEKTAEDYEPLADLSLTHTRTRGISRALALPSIVFLEILLAVLLMSVLFVREKEQDILSLYATMPNGRCRLMWAKIAAVTLGIVIINFLLLETTVLTGCLLYGAPTSSDWTQPLQAMVGYKAAYLPVSIITFLLLVYVGSVLVSVFFAVLTVFLGLLFRSSRMVYIALFLLVGFEGILYLKIDDLSYLANWKRINLVAFSDVAGRLGRYHNLYVFYKPVNDWIVALVLLLTVGLILLTAVAVPVSKGAGLYRRGRGRRLPLLGRFTKSAGCHGSIFLHECYKYLRLERIGIVFLLLLVWALFFTKPYRQAFTVEDMHYRGYLQKLQAISPEDYGKAAAEFREEFEQSRQKSGNSGMLNDREQALANIESYVAYLQPLEGASAVDEKAIQLFYNNRRQNILMGAASLLLVILCATSLYYVEYRTGMNEMIRITAVGRRRVPLWKMLLLLASILLVFVFIYGRYCYRIQQGCNTTGLAERAYSMRNLSDWSEAWSIRGYIILVYLKRFTGLLLGAFVSVLMIRKVKSFIFAVVGSVLVMVLPLLLCFFEAGILDKFLLNWFFL